MLESNVSIVQITEEPRYDDRGTPYAVIRVAFKVDGHGPFVERFKKDDYTAEVRDAKLNMFAREVRS